MSVLQQLGRGAATLAASVAALGLGAGAASAQTFTSAEYVELLSASCAQAPTTPYGTAIEVSGLPATTPLTSVGIDGLTVAGAPLHMRMLLVAPSGQTTMLTSGQGGTLPIWGVSFSFADWGQGLFSDTPQEGAVYAPAGIQHPQCSDIFAFTTAFPAPAPPASVGNAYGSGLSAVGDADPNGTWRLYVVSTGAVLNMGGWSLTFGTPDPEPSACAGEPVACWRFGEDAATTLTDSTGNGHDGAYVNGPVPGQDGAPGFQPDTAALFDGLDDLGRIPDAPGLDVGSTFTLEGWIKRSADGRSHAMFNKGDRGPHLVVMGAAAGNEIYLRKANVTTLARSSAGVPADGAFHHVVATMDGPGTARIYLDGVDVTVPVPGQGVHAIQDTAFPLVFGGGASTAATFDEFALYDRALSADEVAAHHAAGSGGAVVP